MAENEKQKLLLSQVKENLYLLIPMVCIVVWAILFIISSFFDPRLKNFQFIYFDYKIWYGAGKQILQDPAKLYSTDYGYDIGYTWMPFWAMLFAISLSLIPYFIGYFILFTINIFSAILFIREFNKILALVNVNNKQHRFIFLIIISNGFLILNVFRQNQTKFIVGLILMFILRREIQWRKEDIEKDLKYYFINYGIFVFAIGMAPFFIYLLLIYIFQEIEFKELLIKNNILKYAIVVLMFALQNILFIIYPNLIFDFLNGFYENANFFIFYLYEWVILYDIQTTIINYIFTIATFILVLILIINKKLNLEVKFGYFALFTIFFSLFANRVLMILLPLVMLLFIPFLKQDEIGTEFVKKNIILLIGFIAIMGLYLNVNPETIYNIITSIIPFFRGSVLLMLIYLRWIILLSIMVFSLLTLFLKTRNSVNNLRGKE